MRLPVVTAAPPDPIAPSAASASSKGAQPSAESWPEAAAPEQILAWVYRRFPAESVVVTTAFGMEGCVIIDQLARLAKRLRVYYLDTHFFFPETHDLRRRLEARYPHLSFVNAGTTLTPEQQEHQYGPELWRTNPDLCCRVRKVEPMQQLVRGADVWVTGLRRGQSAARSQLRTVEWDWQFDLLKVSPLAHWSREQVWAYVREHDVPHNALHWRGYPTIGCTHCTKAVPGSKPGDYTRAGRWAGSEKTECGLHLGSAQPQQLHVAAAKRERQAGS